MGDLLLGALGGRLDQTLANLLLPARQEWTVPILLADGRQLARVVRGGDGPGCYAAGTLLEVKLRVQC